MNYFSHGREFLEDPLFLAGTAIPDWLSAIDRKVRVRSVHAAPFAADADPQVSAFARGILQHHRDDAWFHETAAFNSVSSQLAVAIREVTPRDENLRPTFLGHILLELLLDATLIAKDLSRLDAYYSALGSLDPIWIEAQVNRMASRSTDRLAPGIARFLSIRFLYDYLDDAKLLGRLSGVMMRIGQPALPAELIGILPEARSLVAAKADELLARPATP